jgi:predicted DNA-binding protein YlxM (UPF0122 family)
MDILYMKEIQEELKISRSALLNLINDGKIKTFKVGGRHATKKEFINDYINNQIAEAENERNK